MPSFPYAGAVPYTKNDASSFYGREGELSLLADIYTEQAGEKGKILVVYGPSGVGKTSMLLAGLWPLVRRSRDVVRLLHFEPGPEEDLGSFIGRIREEVGRLVAGPDRRPMIFIDQIDQVIGYPLDGGLDSEREAQLAALLAFLSQAAMRGLARVVMALREPMAHSLETAPSNDQFSRYRIEFFRLDFFSQAGLEKILRLPFARWLKAHPQVGVGETAIMEHYFSELTLNPTALPLFSTMARRAHDLRTYPPEVSILDFAVAEAEALFAGWPPERLAKLPIFVELFQAAATTRTKESALSAPMRILAADPDSREIADELIQARLLTLYGQRWDDAEVRLSHEYWLADCPVTAPLLND